MLTRRFLNKYNMQIRNCQKNGKSFKSIETENWNRPRSKKNSTPTWKEKFWNFFDPKFICRTNDFFDLFSKWDFNCIRRQFWEIKAKNKQRNNNSFIVIINWFSKCFFWVFSYNSTKKKLWPKKGIHLKVNSQLTVK